MKAERVPRCSRDWLIVTKRPPPWVAITEARRIAGLHGVTLEWVQGQENSRLPAKIVRRIAHSLRCMGLSLTQIGRMLNRHHSTILTALRRADEADKEFTSPSIRGWADLPRV